MTGQVEPILFHSRDSFFKKPVGAIRGDTEVFFRILTEKRRAVQSARVVVLFDRNQSVARYPMTESEPCVDTNRYQQWETKFPIHDTGLYWYWFEFETPEGIVCAGRSEDDGRAVLTEPGQEPNHWQQTVYQREYEVPEWIEGGVFYHIFVDRFAACGERVELPGKITRTDWGGEPEYRPTPEGKILNRDFFGGNLRGIREKLSYLESLGVTCLYLSPIFEAYSNHKYDTANYRAIDPMFGDEEEFKRLCQAANDHGMRIVLDGVFSHTGSDSIYFDRDGHYGGNGAWQNPASPYRSWYYFEPDGTYQTWWGIETLPRVNKEEPSYVEFITGEDGVLAKWLRDGAAGFRLDVADELPNSFLHQVAAAEKAARPDAILIGEVWEDASNKSSYGERKNYFDGTMLDSVMNYPLRNALVGFVRGGDAGVLRRTMDEIMEHYPQEVVHCLMNHLGTHDTERVLTALGGRDLGPDATRDEMAQVRMSPEEREVAVQRLKMAAALQMTLPGVPCIYYGDEVGMEGYRDPFNRRCYPWGHEDRELLDWYRRLIQIRRSCPVYKDGEYHVRAMVGGLFAFERSLSGRPAERRLTAANAGDRLEEVAIYGRWEDLLTGEVYQDAIPVCPGAAVIAKPLEEADR